MDQGRGAVDLIWRIGIEQIFILLNKLDCIVTFVIVGAWLE